MGTNLCYFTFLPRKRSTIIRIKDKNGIIPLACRFQFINHLADKTIHAVNIAVHDSNIAAHNAVLRIIGWQHHIVGRDVKRIFRTFPHLLLMRGKGIEYSEKRHPFRTVAPMRLPATFVPSGQRRKKLIVGFRVVRTIIASGT